MTNYPTNEDFLVEVESALEKQLLPEPGFAALERTRDAVMGAVYPLVAELRNQPRAVEPAGELREPDNPAAHALAKYIADHPISTVQAAFRYLNTPLTLTVRADTGREPIAARLSRMADAWERRLPETVRTATVVDAVRHVIEVYESTPTDNGQPVDAIDWKAKYELEHARHVAVVGALLADRSAVLRGEAARIRAHCPDHLDSDSASGAWMVCHCDVADDIERRLADEAQQASPRCTCADAGPEFAPAGHYADCPVAAEAQHAQSGVDTPGCDCGHEGMGAKWHAKACVWRAGLNLAGVAR